MSGGRLQLRFFISASLVCLAVSPCLAGQMHHRVKKTETIPAPVTTPIPLTPAQMPATPATVVFKAGQLTVTAPNSTLGDILHEVRRQTGASIDIPGNATERVMGVFGPGPVRDVLAVILNGSHFNYVLLGSATDPTALERVVLFSKPPDVPANQQTSAQVQAPPQPAAPPGGAQAEGAFSFGDDSADNQQDSTDIFGNADDQSNQAQADDQQQGQVTPFGEPNNGVKTPQQLLQELQQQQQQQQQQGQEGQQPGQNPNNFFPGGPRFRPGAAPGMPPQPQPQSDPQQ